MRLAYVDGDVDGNGFSSRSRSAVWSRIDTLSHFLQFTLLLLFVSSTTRVDGWMIQSSSQERALSFHP